MHFVDLVKGQCNETKSDSLSNLFNVTGIAPVSVIIWLFTFLSSHPSQFRMEVTKLEICLLHHIYRYF